MTAQHETPPALRAMTGESLRRRRVAVIGGGLVGNATACSAARMGGDRVQVDLYEAATVGHEGGASIDVTRVFRHVYGEQAHYSRWNAEAVCRWRELERQSDRTLYRPTGGVWVAHASDRAATSSGMERPFSPAEANRLLEVSLRTMRALGLPCEMLDGAELRRRYPQFADDSIAAALFDEEAGILHARDTVLALSEVGERHGVRRHDGMRAVEIAPSADSCGVRFADWSSIEADVVVVAANGWTEALLPGLADRMVVRPSDDPLWHGSALLWHQRGIQVTEQPLFYFAPPASVGDEFSPGRFPVFLFVNARVYGLPAHQGAVKAANNDPSRVLERPEARRLASQAYRDQLYGFLVGQFPGLRDAALMQERVCFYDRSPDEDFVMDQWDDQSRVIVACGFSGHGFKFGPLLGARLAHYALSGQRPADLAPFSLSRFAPQTAG